MKTVTNKDVGKLVGVVIISFVRRRHWEMSEVLFPPLRPALMGDSKSSYFEPPFRAFVW